MKSINISEDQLGDLNAVAQSLFGDETDPRSRSYKRVLVRPEIKWGVFVLLLAIPAALAVAFCVFYDSVPVDDLYKILFIVLAALVYLFFAAKPLIIILVQIYQRFAPASIRMRCRFEPSCSQYMILSVQKHGALRGAVRGVGRLCRCNGKGGGYDYP